MGTMSKIPTIHSYDESSISFYNIDRHLLQTDFNKIESLDDLLDHIKAPIAVDDENRNIYLARSIVVLQVMLNNDFVEELPLDVAETMICERDVETFLNICRVLDIPCEIIQGELKDFTNYRHETFPEEWCAFLSNGCWHLVDFLGMFASTSYRETEGRIVLESEGETVFDKPEEHIETFQSIILSDFWFCTNPKIFTHYNFPNDQQWLLVDKSKGPRSTEDFYSMPFTYFTYHELGLQFLSEYSSILHSENGRCTISLRADPIVLRSHCFSYVLSFVEGTGDISGIKKDDLPLLVRYAPGIDTFSFNIRFPVPGHFVFEVKVKELDDASSLEECFDVIIICGEADPNCRKLPVDAGIVGFGYGHTAKETGLKNPSKTSPTVNVDLKADDDEMPSILTFQIEDDQIDTFDYCSSLVGADDRKGFTETHVDALKGKLTVVAGVKTEGEYALSITARPRDSNDAPDTVLNYILTTSENDGDEKQEKLMKKKKLEMILESKMEGRVLEKTELTKKIDAIEEELKELRKLMQIEEEEIQNEAGPEAERHENTEKSIMEESENKDYLDLKADKKETDRYTAEAGDEDETSRHTAEGAGKDETDKLTTGTVINTVEDRIGDTPLKISDGEVGGKIDEQEKSEMKEKHAFNAQTHEQREDQALRTGRHLSSNLPEHKVREKKTEITTKTKMCCLM